MRVNVNRFIVPDEQRTEALPPRPSLADIARQNLIVILLPLWQFVEVVKLFILELTIL